MGLDAQAFSSPIPRRWFQWRPKARTLKVVEQAAYAWAAERNLGPLFQFKAISDKELAIEIIPVADPIILRLQENRVTASFRSSNGGPGFHAAAIHLLDSIGQALKITWQWTATAGEQLDETGFATHRSFPQLQYAMADFLNTMCSANASAARADLGDATVRAFCIPFGLGHMDGKISCPLGFVAAEWADSVSEMDDAALSEAASEFFVWWQDGLTATTWTQLLRAQLWQNAEWRPPVSASDRLVQYQMRHTYSRLMEQGAMLPDDLEQAMGQYLQCQTAADPPAETGIGYRKYLVWRQLYESWAISVPGYLHLGDDGEKASLEHPAFWLGTAALEVTKGGAASEPFIWPERFDSPVTQIQPGLFFRKSRKEHDGKTGVQMAMICSTRAGRHALLLLTLSSHLDWPFEQFDRWIMTTSCPDLPSPTPPTSTTLH